MIKKCFVSVQKVHSYPVKQDLKSLHLVTYRHRESVSTKTYFCTFSVETGVRKKCNLIRSELSDETVLIKLISEVS